MIRAPSHETARPDSNGRPRTKRPDPNGRALPNDGTREQTAKGPPERAQVSRPYTVGVSQPLYVGRCGTAVLFLFLNTQVPRLRLKQHLLVIITNVLSCAEISININIKSHVRPYIHGRGNSLEMSSPGYYVSSKYKYNNQDYLPLGQVIRLANPQTSLQQPSTTTEVYRRKFCPKPPKCWSLGSPKPLLRISAETFLG